MKASEILNKLRKKRAIARIRREMAWWGHDMSNMSDEEIEAGVICFSKAVVQVGVTASEMAKGLTAISRALRVNG